MDSKKRGILTIIILISIVSVFILASSNEQSTDKKQEIITIETSKLKNLEPHEHGGGDPLTHGEYIYSEIFVTKKDMIITSFKTNVNNAHKSTLHHVTLDNLDKEKKECNFESYHEILLAEASDFTEEGINFGKNNSIGIFVKKGTPLRMAAMIHNALPPYGTNESYTNVSVSMEVNVSYDVDNYEKTKTIFLILEEKYCQSIFTIPENKSNVIIGQEKNMGRGSYVFENSGKIISTFHHVHPLEGGKNFTLYKNGERIVELVSNKNNSDPYHWTRQTNNDIIPIEKGDKIYIEVTYDNYFNESIYGAMGRGSILFVKDDSLIESKIKTLINKK